MRIFVFAERDEAYLELCGGAQELGDHHIEAIKIESQGEIERQTRSLVDKLWLIRRQEGAMLEDYTETIAGLLSREKPEALLVESSKRCKLIAGRLAVMLGACVITDVIELGRDGVASQMIYGGAAVRKVKPGTQITIVIVPVGVLRKGNSTDCRGEVSYLEFTEPKKRIRVLKREKRVKVSVDLPSAKRVIGVGRGITKEEDLEMIRQLAEAINAEIGCTRPIAESEKWMPKETYIGVSGLMLAPEVYISIGISGQIQHTVGINRSKVVIAINNDGKAPIFQQADYGIVGDLYKVVPALVSHFKKT